MKILLIEPTRPYWGITAGWRDKFEPLALEYIAAGVSQDHDVMILDMRLDKDLQSTLRDFRPDVVGTTSFTLHVNTVKSLLQEIKEWNPQVLTVVGGHHATVAPEDFLSPSIDLIVIGEGFFVFKEIIARFEKGNDFDGIPGTAFAREGALVRTDYSMDIDLDSLPFPDRSLTAKYRKHYFLDWMSPIASMRTSKGCPHRCNFCVLWKLTGGRYFRRKPEKVVEELAGIDEKYVFFADDESLLDTTRMKTMANLIKEAGIKKQYFLWSRSDTIAKNPELIEMWKDIGLSRVFVGFEFGRDEDLEYIRKGSTTSDNEKAARILQDLGIQIDASFMVRPDFTRADFAALRQYCRHLELEHTNFFILTPFPGTDLYEELQDKLVNHNHDYYDAKHAVLPTQLPLKEFYDEYHHLHKAAIPRIRNIKHLMRYPLKEIPSILLRRYLNVIRHRSAYFDHHQE